MSAAPDPSGPSGDSKTLLPIFSCVTVLFVLVGIVIVVSLLLPALQTTRNRSRRLYCANNLRRIASGLYRYCDIHRVFPMGVMPRLQVPDPPQARTGPLGPSWQFSILPFVGQNNLYRAIAGMTCHDAVPALTDFCANEVNQLPGQPLARLVPDYMRCPSSPLDLMQTQAGPICLPSYVGIAGGTDITRGEDSGTPLQYPGAGSNDRAPSSTRGYINSYMARVVGRGTGGGDGFLTSSGMLPACEHVGMRRCTDGTSNVMIVSEQSDWLRSADRTSPRRYHGDPGWSADTGKAGGWLSGTGQALSLKQQYKVAGLPRRTSADMDSVVVWPSGRPDALFNITTVRWKPNEKQCMQPARVASPCRPVPLPGCNQSRNTANRGINNPLQSAHPGGVYIGMVDGSVRLIASTVDLAVLLRLAIRDDGQRVKLD